MALHPIPADRAAWLAQRDRAVGSSEVAALFGVQADYALSHYALHHVKAGAAPAPEVSGPRVAWGTRLEEVVAMAAAEENGWQISKGRYATADDCPGMGASLDFEIAEDPTGAFKGPGVLETKNVDWLVHKRSWVGSEPPIHILLQLQHQLACTGWNWGAVAALVGGNQLAVYPYERRPKLIADIKARVRDFWQRIDEGRPPDIDGSAGAAEVLRSLYPEPIDDAIDMSANNEWPEAAAQFLEAQKRKKEAEADYDLARNRMMQLLGDHKRGYGGGYSANLIVVAAKEDRPARPGEIINGRTESRRLNVKETVDA